MLSKQIDRYIIREVFSPTLLCLVIFTMVMAMGRIFKLADLIINKGVPLADILVLLATLLPTFFSITLPLAFLMGIMIGVGRMSADSETVALKSAGIGLSRLSKPIFALAFIFVLLSGVINIWVKPWGHRAFETKSFEIARQKMTIGFQPRTFMNQFNDLVIYANEIDDRGGEIHGLMIVEKKPESTSWVFAERGNILADEKSETVTIRLHDGVIHRQQTASVGSYQLIYFRDYDIQPEVAATEGSLHRKEKPNGLPTRQLWDSAYDEKDPLKALKLQAELHFRLSSPLAPLLFVLFGMPFSIQSHRSGRSGGFVVGLVIFLVYYFMLSTASTMTEGAAIPPWLTFWIPHFLLGVTGCYFFWQASMERQNLLISWLDQAMLTLQKRVRKNVDS